MPPPPTRRKDDRGQIGLAGLLIALGMGYLIAGKKPWLPVNPAQKSTLQSLSMSGQLQLPPRVTPSQVRFHIHLPEIPLDEFRNGSELSGQGDFKINFQFHSTQAPTVVALNIQATEAGELNLQRLPLRRDEQGGLSCQLARLTLPERRIEQKPTYRPPPPARLAPPPPPAPRDST